jgi:iron complex outermembrane receptor protein
MKLIKGTITALCTIFFSLSSFAVAEEKKQDGNIKLEEVVVTATKTERKVTEVPASVTVITAEEIEAMQVTKTEDILRNIEGVDVRGFGGINPGEVTIRGIRGSFTGATTQILINGLPVEPIQLNSRFPWNLVLPKDIERIEIVRGPASALHGPNAIGGVINIITKRGKGKPSIDATGGYGSHNAYSVDASAGGAVNKFDFRIGASHHDTSGYKRIPQASPDKTIDLDGRDYTDNKFDTTLGYRFSNGHEISLSLNYFDAEGAGYGGRPNYRQGRNGYNLGLDYRNRISDIIDLKARFSRSDLKLDYTEDSYNPTVPGSSLNLTAQGKTVETLWNAEIQTDLYLFKGNTLTLGVSYSPGEIKRRRENAAGSQTWGQDSKTEVLGFYIQDEHRFGEKVIVTVGGRYDKFKFFDDRRYNTTTKVYDKYPDSDDDIFNPRGGIRLNLTKTTSLWASAGTAYVPALNTLKYVGNANFQDNPNLKPEKSVTYEIGVDQAISDFLKGKASFYQTKYKDRISAISVGATTWPKQYRNIAETEIDGLELALEAVIADYWYPFINYTYTDAKITKNPTDITIEGKRPEFIPFNKINIGLMYDNPKILNARVAGRYIGDRYWDAQNTAAKRLGDFFVTYDKVSKKFSIGNTLKDINVSFAVNNIFDRKYSEFGYYEMEDGRNFWVEVGFRF